MPQYITDASTIKTIATTLAACSAAWIVLFQSYFFKLLCILKLREHFAGIALRGKLNWDKKFAEYRNACKTYTVIQPGEKP